MGRVFHLNLAGNLSFAAILGLWDSGDAPNPRLPDEDVKNQVHYLAICVFHAFDPAFRVSENTHYNHLFCRVHVGLPGYLILNESNLCPVLLILKK